MKPRLRKLQGVWYCFIKCGRITRRFGEGFTPKEAFRDWERRQV